MAQPISGRRVLQSARENEKAHRTAEQPVREVAQERVQLLLCLVEQIATGPLDNRQILGAATLVFVMLEHHRSQIHVREDIAEPCREILLLLQVAAEAQHCHIDREGEARREAHDVLVIPRGGTFGRHLGEACVGEGHDERAHGVAQREADVAEQRAVEVREPLLAVRVTRSFHFLEHERMAAHRPLTKDDEAARQDVRAFHGDGHRNDLITTAEIVAWAEADALATVHVHGIVCHLTTHLGDVVLEHGRRDRRLLATVDGARRDRSRCVHGVGVSHHPRDHALDAFELSDWHVELAPDAGVGTGGEHRSFAAARAARGQRNAATHGELLDQHAPALTHHLWTTNDEVERNEHVLALDRTVLERHVQREVSSADAHTTRAARDQRAGDAYVDGITQQLLRIEQSEGEADDCRHRGERDVALGEVEPQTNDLATFPQATAYNAGVGEGGGIGAGTRAGQCEAGNVLAAGESRQVVILLLLGAVVLQQFAGTQRVGHGHRRGHRGAARGQFGEHAGVSVRGEFETAVLLLDDHREEAVALEEVPHLGRHVAAAMRDVEVVDHPAQLFAGSIEERLLLGRQLRRLGAEQFRPVGFAGEQFAVPPDRAGLERFALGARHRRQHATVDLHERS